MSIAGQDAGVWVGRAQELDCAINNLPVLTVVLIRRCSVLLLKSFAPRAYIDLFLLHDVQCLMVVLDDLIRVLVSRREGIVGDKLHVWVGKVTHEVNTLASESGILTLVINGSQSSDILILNKVLFAATNQTGVCKDQSTQDIFILLGFQMGQESVVQVCLESRLLSFLVVLFKEGEKTRIKC